MVQRARALCGEGQTTMKILAIEPYYGGSHQAFL